MGHRGPRRFRPGHRRLGDFPSPPSVMDPGAGGDLQYIRQTMERSSVFTAVSGRGMMVIGISALAVAWLSSRHPFDEHWLQLWIAEAAFAICVSLLAIRRKALRHGLPWTSGPARKVAFSFAPAIVAGAVLTFPMLRAGLSRDLPGLWLVLYGCGTVAAGAFSLSIVPLMGATFMVAGAAALLLPALPSPMPIFNSANLEMAAGFGVLHLLFGFWIARRHGG